MKAKLYYYKEFFIPRELPHAWRDDTPPGDDIFQDAVFVDGGELVVLSAYGTTRIPMARVVKTKDDFRVKKGTIAYYEGAFNAMNAVWGVKWPDHKRGECHGYDAESTYGFFPSLYQYMVFRQAIGKDVPYGEDRLYAQLMAIKKFELLLSDSDAPTLSEKGKAIWLAAQMFKGALMNRAHFELYHFFE